MIVVWRVTERCNLSCKFCAYDRDLVRARHDASPKRILDFCKVLAEYQETTGEKVLVSWLGGEPLLWQPLTRITQVVSKDCRLQVSTTTNGTTLKSSAVRAHLLDCYTELTISVDGFATFHNLSRGWENGFEGLRKSVHALAQEKRTRAQGPLLRANVVLMRDNIKEFPGLCEELCDWGIEEITFNQLGGIDRPGFFPEHRLKPKHVAWLESIFTRLAERLRFRGVRLRGSNAYLQRLKATSENIRMPVPDCRPAEAFLFINEHGRVAPCSFTSSEYGISVEEITSVEELRRFPVRFARMRSERRSSFCDDCHSTQQFEKFAA